MRKRVETKVISNDNSSKNSRNILYCYILRANSTDKTTVLDSIYIEGDISENNMNRFFRYKIWG